MSKNKKLNHALEHGTIYFLKKSFGNSLRVGGQAEKNGFRIFGVSKKHDITMAFDKFINEEYAGEYEQKLIAEFDTYLPEKPPWER